LRAGKKDHSGLLMPRAKDRLDIRVTPAGLDRALRIMDAFVKAADARGYTLDITGDPSTTRINCLGEMMAIRLEEQIRRLPHTLTAKEEAYKLLHHWSNAPQWDYQPTGILSLGLVDIAATGVRKTWSDGKRQRLEDELNGIMIGLVRAAEGIKQERFRRDAWQRKWDEEQRQREERERQRRIEQRRAEELTRQLDAVSKAARIREYAKDLAAAGIVLLPAEEAFPKTLTEWVDWARGYADRMDPLTNGRRHSGGGSPGSGPPEHPEDPSKSLGES
jgi:hypothetical protein